MHIAFLNPQGNFDPHDSYWAQHPDFGGQLVYVKEVAHALAEAGHRVDILTRRIIDPQWPQFSEPLDAYEGVAGVRIVRLPCGPNDFLPKEQLWPHLGTDWVGNIIDFYRNEGRLPEIFTAHYADGGLVGALLQQATRSPFTFTAHSLGAQKMDKLEVTKENLTELDRRYNFSRRILAERVSMSHAARIFTSTMQERNEQYGHLAYRGAVDPRDEARFAVVPPGVNRRIFSPQSTPLDDVIAERIAAALARDVSDERRELPLVLASSRLDPKKNHLGLVQAFAYDQKLQAGANLAIVVRGLEDPLRDFSQLDGHERAVLREIVGVMDEHQLWGKVTAFPLNSQMELAAAYRHLASRRAVFALTALYEPFGLAPLEAMSSGLPVVVTRNGGPSESLREGDREFGVLVDPRNPADIAAGLLRIVGDPQAWAQFQKAGLERVMTQFTWARTASGYLKVFHAVRESGAILKGPPIHPYFTDPRQENEIALSQLEDLYFD